MPFKAVFECDRCDFKVDAEVIGDYQWKVRLPVGAQVYHWANETYLLCDGCVDEIQDVVRKKLESPWEKPKARNQSEVA